MNKYARYIKNIFFPKKCESCNRLIPFNEEECIDCTGKQYRVTEEFCVRCGKRNCICTPDGQNSNLSVPFIYTGKIRQYIHRYKFGKEKQFADFFAKNLYESVVEDFGNIVFDFVTFIPSDNKGIFTFNHSELISIRLSRLLGCRCAPLLTRKRKTLKQHYLSYEARISNMKNAFSVINPNDVKGKRILICDDIRTTGSTLFAAEKALLESGAEKVYCCAVATPVFGGAQPLDKEQ